MVIRDYAFAQCTSLKKINIPETVKAIERNAFEGCSSLMSITIPKSVRNIEEHVFQGCPSEFVIYGHLGSYAETYANENHICFEAIN